MNEPGTLPPELELAFLPLHKRALGTAIGLASGLFFFALTAVTVLLDKPDTLDLKILGEYFYGYTITWQGAFIAFFWGGFAGFVAGWFAAFMHNFIIAASLWLGRNRADLAASRDFLDHI